PVKGGGFEPVRASFRADNNENKMVIGRVGATAEVPWLDSFGAGFSFGFGKYDDFDRRSIRMFGFDAALRKGPFELKGEYAWFSLERGQAEIDAGAPGGASGWYVEGDWHFFPRCWRGRACLLNEESLFTIALRYDRIDTDDSARGIDRATRG